MVADPQVDLGLAPEMVQFDALGGAFPGISQRATGPCREHSPNIFVRLGFLPRLSFPKRPESDRYGPAVAPQLPGLAGHRGWKGGCRLRPGQCGPQADGAAVVLPVPGPRRLVQIDPGAIGTKFSNQGAEAPTQVLGQTRGLHGCWKRPTIQPLLGLGTGLS